jgi:hypothetical protein
VLPASSGDGACACLAADADGVPVGQCGGVLGTLCPTGKCCADDVRDGCDPDFDRDCPGICVTSDGCDPRRDVCGICFDQRSAPDQSCGSGSIRPGEDCCVEGGSCRSGSSYCYCASGSLCVTDGSRDLCCTATRPQLCPGLGCAPEGADCCGGRTFCAAGSVCTDTDPVKCCPVDKPQPCPDLSGCVREGATCCGGGVSCLAGLQCDDTSDPPTCVASPAARAAAPASDAGRRREAEAVAPLSSPE